MCAIVCTWVDSMCARWYVYVHVHVFGLECIAITYVNNIICIYNRTRKRAEYGSRGVITVEYIIPTHVKNSIYVYRRTQQTDYADTKAGMLRKLNP